MNALNYQKNQLILIILFRIVLFLAVKMRNANINAVLMEGAGINKNVRIQAMKIKKMKTILVLLNILL